MWVVAVALLVVVLILAQLVNRPVAKGRTTVGPDAFKAAAVLLTPTEQRFWDALQGALSPGVVACPKVRMIDVLKPRDGKDTAARNRVIQKHLDFVLIDARSTRILAALELDDSSHTRQARRERDGFVDAALGAAGVPVLRFRASGSYDAVEVGSRMREALSSSRVPQIAG